MTGLFTFDKGKVSFSRMVVDSQKKPMLVTVEHGKTITLPEDPDQKDVDFYQLIARIPAEMIHTRGFTW